MAPSPHLSSVRRSPAPRQTSAVFSLTQPAIVPTRESPLRTEWYLSLRCRFSGSRKLSWTPYSIRFATLSCSGGRAAVTALTATASAVG